MNYRKSEKLGNNQSDKLPELKKIDKVFFK